MQHVRRVHPELADGTTETEDDDADHSYFNSKLDLPPQPASPPPLPPRRPLEPHFTRGLMSRRGRRRPMTRPAPAANYYSRADRYVTIVDRRERRNQLRIDKELEDRVKQLRRWTCARSRSIDEHRTMGRGNILTSTESYQSEAPDDGTEASGAADIASSSPAVEPYPYHDHSYFSQTHGPDSGRLQALWKMGSGRPGPPGTTGSAFQECETMLLGLRPSSRGTGRRGRGRGRGGGTAANRRVSFGADTSEDMDPIDPAIRDLDLMAESELLLRPAGDYSLLQDILGPHCMSTSHTTPGSTSLRQATSPMKSPGPVPARTAREPTQSSVTPDGGLNDSMSMDEASATAPSDLDDIELCEDDYRLFDPRSGSQDQHPATTSNAVNTTQSSRSWENRAVSGTGGVRRLETDNEEKDMSIEQENPDVVGDASVSADDCDDETCSATSEPACTSLDETDNTSIPHDDDDDVDVVSDVDVDQ